MEIAINKIHFPVSTLGFGQRLGIWFQGCSIRCPGCISRDTWEGGESYLTNLDQLLETTSPWLQQADGVTISGGEPFDQPHALRELLSRIREQHSGDLLVFSGYPMEKLASEHAAAIELIDVLISDPFDTKSEQTMSLRGSDNQRIHLRTDIARERYPTDLDTTTWGDSRGLDLMVDGDEIWMAGIPRQGEMARLRKKLEALGYSANTSDQPPVPIRA